METIVLIKLIYISLMFMFTSTKVKVLSVITGIDSELLRTAECPRRPNFNWSVGLSSVCTAFMPSSGYISLVQKRNAFTELLPITPVFKHPKNDQHSPGIYVDVIVHADKLKHGVSEILDLRGCRWACVREDTLANGVMLNALQQLGENITFFGSSHRTVSHLASVNMVLTKQVEVATVDANSLICNKRFLYNGAKDVVVLTSFGPFSPYAVVINSRIKGVLRNKIISALNGINEQFEKFGLLKFVPNRMDYYEKEIQFMKTVKTEKSNVPYY